MTAETQRRIGVTVRNLVELLVTGRYEELEAASNGERLSAAEIEAGVVSYGRTLSMPPDEAFKSIDVIPIRNTSPQEFSIRFRLYTEEEGRSDLEVQATLIEGSSDAPMMLQVDNILVA